MKSELPITDDFWPLCSGPGKMLAPVLDKLTKKHLDSMVVTKINTNEHFQEAINNQIIGNHTMPFVDHGKVAH